MLFFRSEEHLENWAQYNPELKEGKISLADLMTMFSGSYFTERLNGSYVSNMKTYMMELGGVVPNLKSAGSFWKL